jgi:hypothetical protein
MTGATLFDAVRERAQRCDCVVCREQLACLDALAARVTELEAELEQREAELGEATAAWVERGRSLIDTEARVTELEEARDEALRLASEALDRLEALQSFDPATPRRGGPHSPRCAWIVTGGDVVCDCPPALAAAGEGEATEGSQ